MGAGGWKRRIRIPTKEEVDRQKAHWFEPEVLFNIKGRKPFATYLWKHSIKFVEQVLKDKIPNRHTKTAIEFGPGELPTILNVGFGKALLVDVAATPLEKLRVRAEIEKGLQNLKRLYESERNRIADLKNKHDPERLPISANTKVGFAKEDITRLSGDLAEPADVIVLNEVFTHINPKKRGLVVDTLTKNTDRILVLDYRKDWPRLKDMDPEIRKHMVSPYAIKLRLQKLGFEVEDLKTQDPAYFCLFAEKKKPKK